MNNHLPKPNNLINFIFKDKFRFIPKHFAINYDTTGYVYWAKTDHFCFLLCLVNKLLNPLCHHELDLYPCYPPSCKLSFVIWVLVSLPKGKLFSIF